MKFNKSFKIIFWISFVVFVFSFFLKNRMPSIENIAEEAYKDPIQKSINIDPFEIISGEHTAHIAPKYAYDLSGLVVSAYDSGSWLDFTHKNDPFNTRDLCIVWGDNIKSEVYKEAEFSHGEFTCFVEFENDAIYSKFYGDSLSNNHFLPQNNNLRDILKRVEIGDQVRFKGYLVDYAINNSDSGIVGSRKTSVVREDSGNGACEIVFSTDFEILKEGNKIWRLLYKLSKYSLVLCLIFLFFSRFEADAILKGYKIKKRRFKDL